MIGFKSIPAFALTAFAEICSADAGIAPESLIGKYGFDWLKPQHAKCQAVSANLAKKFRHCRTPEEGSFTGQGGYRACKGSGGEFLVYDTKARCVEELETMRANAP